MAKKIYFSRNSRASNNNVTRATKIRLYATLTVPIPTYGSQLWTLSEIKDRRQHIFKGKNLLKIFGAIKENKRWRLGYNCELYNLYKNIGGSTDLVITVKFGRLRLAGQVFRSGSTKIIKKVFESQPVGLDKEVCHIYDRRT